MSDMWMLATYRGKRWPYLQLPNIGDGIRYMDDGFDVAVAEIRATYVLLTDGTVMRKRVHWGMIWAWIEQHNFMRNVKSWRAANRRRETWVDAGIVLYNG